MKKPLMVAAAAGAIMLLPAAAQGATKDVYAGTPPKGTLKGVPPFAVDNAFYPKRVTIAKGDRLAFRLLGFHNVLFAVRGQQAPPLFAPNPEDAISGAKDAAGRDMWFNGQPRIVPNPGVALPSGGKVVDGSEVVGSGLPLGGPPKPFKVRFPDTGTYTFLCSVHPGMKGTVTVKGKRSQVPSAKQDARRVRKQVLAAAKLGKRLAAGKGVPSGNVIRAGNDKRTGATIAFFPATKTVKAGVPVRFELSPGTTEIHNVALGPADYIGGLAQSFLGPQGLDPFTTYPSDPPGTPLVYDGTNHGNGYLNTGILDTEAGTPNPDRASITFAKPGTYTYYCVVHGAEMKGTVEVTS